MGGCVTKPPRADWDCFSQGSWVPRKGVVARGRRAGLARESSPAGPLLKEPQLTTVSDLRQPGGTRKTLPAYTKPSQKVMLSPTHPHLADSLDLASAQGWPQELRALAQKL